ncbi:MAG: hypothetical protein WCA49_17920 [Candidatus Sulfotelmatobacter sp.]
MIAKIDNGNAKRKRPQMRLAIALPLVCAGKIAPPEGGPSKGAVAEPAETSFPHTLQNFSPTATLFPQPEQNTLASQAMQPALSELTPNTTPYS